METIDYQSEDGGDQIQGSDNQGGNDSKIVEVHSTTELISSTSDIDRENTVDAEKASSPDDGLPCNAIPDEVIEEVMLNLFLYDFEIT